MKTLIAIIAYILVTVLMYLLVSSVGLIWCKWEEIIHHSAYNAFYWLCIGWWIAIPILDDFAQNNKKN